MEIETICNGKYEFYTEKKTISLPVELKNLPDQLIVKERTLFKRSEFHVSLVCINKIIEKYNINIPDVTTKIVNDFCEFTKDNEIKVLSYKDEFKFVEREDKTTIVVMCETLNLHKFFDFINKKYSLEVDLPPAHVTLFTLDGKSGIYLISPNDIKNFTQPIPNPLGHSL